MEKRTKPCYTTECRKTATFGKYCLDHYIENLCSGVDPQLKMPDNGVST